MNEQLFIDLVLKTHSVLQQETDLSPKNPVINETLGHFVSAILQADKDGIDAQEVLSDPKVISIRQDMLRLLWQAEMNMELYFSDLFLEEHRQTSKAPNLSKFWYLNCYAELIEDEVKALVEATDGKKINNVAFIGSGPLPLSALMFHEKTGVKVTCIDVNPDASEKGKALLNALGYPDDVIDHLNLDGTEVDYADYELVFMATMTGSKADIVRRINDTADDECVVAIRSAENLRTLLYEVVKPDDFDELIQTAILHPRESVINCTCFFRKAAHNLGVVAPQAEIRQLYA